MKKIKQLVAIFVSAVILISNLGISSYAAELNNSNQSEEENSKIKVYDSRGNLVAEFDSLEEYNKYYGSDLNSDDRAVISSIIIGKFIFEVGVGLVVIYAARGIDNLYEYLENYHITMPSVNPGDTITITSLDGNIYNPYPPNSYQAITWEQNNFRVVVS